MPSWENLSLTVSPEVTAASQTVARALQAFSQAMTTYRDLLSATIAQQTDPGTAIVQALNLAIQELVSAAQEQIDQLLQGSGIYVLTIPVPKRSLVNPNTVTDPNDRAAMNPTYFPIGPFLRDIPDEQRERLYARIDFAGLFDPTAANVGGNAHLIKSVGESLYDAGDINRPRWRGSMYWAYAALVVGASDYGDIVNLLVMLDSLFGGVTGRTVNMARSQTTLVPRTLNVRVLYMDDIARPAVQVEWEPVTVSQQLSALNAARLVPTRIAVIRSTDFRCRSTRRVADLFGSTDLRAGMTGQYGATVLSEGQFDGLSNRYLDTQSLVEGTEYYYHVAFQTRLEQPGRAPVTTGYATLSPVGFIRYTGRQPSPHVASHPPDWIRTPSIAAMIQPLGQMFYRLRLELDRIAASTQSFTDRQQAYLQFVNQQIQRYSTDATTLVNNLERLVQMFTLPTSGVGGYTQYATGHGPVSDFLASFVESLTDPNDATRPPFDDGTEYTAGLLFLAAGPDPARVSTALLALQALFAPSAPGSPTQQALAQINQTIAVAERTALDTLAATPSNTFGADMSALPPGTPDPTCTS